MYLYSLLQKWRNFCQTYENRVEDFNMGTLIRLRSAEDFSEENSSLGMFILSSNVLMTLPVEKTLLIILTLTMLAAKISYMSVM